VSNLRKIAVLMGGVSSEHEVSLNSGGGVLEALDRTLYTPLPIVITREGGWAFDGAEPVSIFEAVPRLQQEAIDCAFIALHGPFGEDGRFQGMLDLLGIPYTGSGCAASALAMDKDRCKAVVSTQGIRVAGHISLDRATWAVDPDTVLDAVSKDVGFPCVIKPARQGSSVGIVIPQNLLEFQHGIDRVFDADEHILVEEYIAGTEVTCGVLDAEPGGNIVPLPVTEIRPKSAAYFDYAAKYTPGATEETTPARISPELTEAVQEMAAHVHQILDCRGWSRSDFILDEHGPIFIEVNTVPGLTKTSLYPQAAAAAGIGYSKMVSLFIEAALRHAQLGKVHAP